MSQAVRRILVIRRRALGDLIVSLAALGDLRALHPNAEIDLLMDPAWDGPARAWAPVDRVLATPVGTWRRARFALALRGARYDLAVDLLSTPFTALLTWLTGAPMRVGLALAGRSWAYTHAVERPGSAAASSARPTYIGDAMRAVVAAAGARPEEGPATASAAGHPPRRVALAPGSTWSAKAWPAESYVRLARLVLERWQAEVTVFWGPGEEPLARRIVEGAPGAKLAPGGSIVDVGERLRDFDLLFSGDSGARHLAQHLGVATVSVFGPTDPWTQTPPSARHLWLRYPIACSPCQRAACALAENYCLTRVSAEQVFEAAQALRGSPA